MSNFETATHWQTQAKQECQRLIDALGEITAGGVVDNIQHIGATSVPGLPAHACVDLALAVTPFPVDTNQLAALGYQLTPHSSTFEQRAQHTSGHFQLFISEAGSDEWTDHLLVRDFLRHDEAARQRYVQQKEFAKAATIATLLQEAKHWWPRHVGFAPVDFVLQELMDFHHPWFISSGWALDLYLQRVTRVHHDVDVVVDRMDQLALRETLSERGWHFVTPLKGKLESWPPHMRLELPRHQIHAHREGKFIDFLLTDMSHELWRYRRNPLVIRRLAEATQRTASGIPYLSPELLLLYKSKNTGTRPRAQDQADYENVLPHLKAEARAWLRWALIATDPTHPWIDQL